MEVFAAVCRSYGKGRISIVKVNVSLFDQYVANIGILVLSDESNSIFADIFQT